MKHIFEFKDSVLGGYFLMRNSQVYKVWNKSKYSKQEAESAASKVVKTFIKKYGIKNVRYDGAVEVTN